MTDSIPENMTFSIDHENSRITYIKTGEINKENSILSGRLINELEGFDPTYTTLVDLRKITVVNLNAADLSDIAKEISTFDRRTGKIALLIGDRTGRLVLAKLFAEVARILNTPYTYNAFRKRQSAEAWLDSDT